MTNGRATGDAIDRAELRIERRRAQLLRDWDETRAYVAQKNRWTPLAAVVGMAALGFGLSRVRFASAAQAPRAAAARGGVVAAIAAVLGGGLRFALSPSGRALWASFKEARSGR
ncbi:MAG TPA: hypothetical protein VFJ48_09185 [Casimicrobiaceae bacterium]|nr:hypothetical protein [Casimicrobiaceae bacterium]